MNNKKYKEYVNIIKDRLNKYIEDVYIKKDKKFNIYVSYFIFNRERIREIIEKEIKNYNRKKVGIRLEYEQNVKRRCYIIIPILNKKNNNIKVEYNKKYNYYKIEIKNYRINIEYDKVNKAIDMIIRDENDIIINIEEINKENNLILEFIYNNYKENNYKKIKKLMDDLLKE